MPSPLYLFVARSRQKHYKTAILCARRHILLVALGKKSDNPATRGSVVARLFSAGMHSPELSGSLADGEVGPVCKEAL